MLQRTNSALCTSQQHAIHLKEELEQLRSSLEQTPGSNHMECLEEQKHGEKKTDGADEASEEDVADKAEKMELQSSLELSEEKNKKNEEEEEKKKKEEEEEEQKKTKREEKHKKTTEINKESLFFLT